MFSQIDFKSEEGAELYNNTVWTYPYENKEQSEGMKQGGGIMDKLITWTLFAIIAFNVMAGDSTPLLWGMLNTIQIMYFFPLLSFYYPTHLV
jgi:hypothetical protein